MANNLDRLFRENLDQFGVTPASESWGKVESQIAGATKPWFTPMRIAAAITLLMTAGLLVIMNLTDEKDQNYLSNVDHPELQPVPQWSFELPVETNQPSENQAKNNTPAQKASQQMTSYSEQLTFETFSVAALKPELDLEISASITLRGAEIPAPEGPTVRITYIASNQPDSTKQIKLNTLLSYLSNEMSPTDLLADIRDAKDNLFSKN